MDFQSNDISSSNIFSDYFRLYTSAGLSICFFWTHGHVLVLSRCRSRPGLLNSSFQLRLRSGISMSTSQLRKNKKNYSVTSTHRAVTANRVASRHRFWHQVLSRQRIWARLSRSENLGGAWMDDSEHSGSLGLFWWPCAVEMLAFWDDELESLWHIEKERGTPRWRVCLTQYSKKFQRSFVGKGFFNMCLPQLKDRWYFLGKNRRKAGSRGKHSIFPMQGQKQIGNRLHYKFTRLCTFYQAGRCLSCPKEVTGCKGMPRLAQVTPVVVR